ncbi:fimbria/pilus outer membrane usher protein [uncultured Cedecea sp.]|uniref:fimbria/pilus outer membrane usher protein n=1 Tax=uncultured Cedecea sp. TaxID=988762 RepID=UPI002603776D|nr:fimbria/pilus outer membrane usher protein [uncultured Cedecea sp.]
MKKHIIIKLLTSTFFYSYFAHAQDVQFNEQALVISGIPDIDLTAFEKSMQSEGVYFVGVTVNGRKINFFDKIGFVKNENIIQPCLTSSLIQSIGLKNEFIKKIPQWNQGECFDLSSQDANIKVNFDDEKQELHFSIPQIYFEYNDENWIPPQQRDSGVNALVLDYSIIDSYFRGKNSAGSNSLSSYGTAGANIGPWRLRSNYQYQKNNSEQNKKDSLQWIQTYAFTDIPALASKFFIGQHYTSSNIFDSVRFKGASAFSDDNMLPAVLRGYAPQITGTATSNATVTISQSGRILNQVKVPPGPFSIDNLSSSLSGTLDVKVEEEDGSVRQFQVTTTAIPFLTRKGTVSYKVNTGQFDPLSYREVNSGFVSGEASWGLLNDVSAYGGLFSTIGSQYKAYSLGLGTNMGELGALSFDVTQSRSHIKSTPPRRGESYRLSYAKRFSDSSRLNLTGYQFSNEGYMSVNNYVETKAKRRDALYRQKNSFSTSFTQQLPDLNADVNLNYSVTTYWNRAKSSDSLNLSYNTKLNNQWFKDTLLSFSVSQSISSKENRAKQAYLSLSIPFGGDSKSRMQYFGSYNERNHNYSNNVSYSTVKDNNNINIGVSSSNFVENTAMNASVYRDTPYATTQLSGAYGKDHQSLSAAVDGSITLTQQGPVFHRRVYPNQARMIIDTDTASNVSVNDNESITNRFGLAGISNVPTYYRSAQYLDLDNMPDNVSIEDNVIEAALTSGAIGYAKVNAVIGEKVLLKITLTDGTVPPFGATVYDRESNKQLGIVSEQGQTYLTGLKKSQKISVKWGVNQSCQIMIKNTDIQKLKQLTCSKDL